MSIVVAHMELPAASAALSQPERIARLLGGERALEAPANTYADWDRLIRAGLPAEAATALLEALPIQQGRVLESLRIPKSTWSRRLRQKRFAPEESDRLYRLADVVARAEEVLGSREKGVRWLTRPNRALEMEAPLTQLETEAGYESVKTLLGRIEHGVHS